MHLRKMPSVTLLTILCMGPFLAGCSITFLDDMLGKKQALTDSRDRSGSQEVRSLADRPDLTLLELARIGYKLTRSHIRNSEFNVEEFRFFSVEIAYKELVEELEDDINQTWTLRQHLEDLDVNLAAFQDPLTEVEYETAWLMLEELLDTKVNQIKGADKNKKNDEPEDKSEEERERLSLYNTCETPGKDRLDWKVQIPSEDGNTCISRIIHLYATIGKKEAPSVRDAACKDFAFGIRIFEQQYATSTSNLAEVKGSAKGNLEELGALQAQQVASLYGLIQSAKMYETLNCVGGGDKPADY